MAVTVYYHQCRCLHYAVTSCQLHVLLRIDGHVGHIFQIFLHQLAVRAGLGREQILDILRLLHLHFHVLRKIGQRYHTSGGTL